MNGSPIIRPATPSRASPLRNRSRSPTPKNRAAAHEQNQEHQETEELRIIAIEAALRERKDMSGSVSAQQMVKLALFQKEQEKILRMKRLKWYILDPQSNYVQMWDVLTAITLVFTAIATPMEVAFLPAPRCGNEPLFVINRFVDAVFLIDMGMQFLLAHPVKSNLWESRLKVIAMRYLKGWFLVDALAIFPSLFDILPIVDACVDVNSPKSPLATLRVIRSLRLLKLMRLLRTPWGMLKRLIIRISTPRATVTILSLLFECLFVSHIFACLLGMMATFTASRACTRAQLAPHSPRESEATRTQRAAAASPPAGYGGLDSAHRRAFESVCLPALESWLGTHGYCRPHPDMPEGYHQCVGAEVQYLQCLFWSVGMLMGAPISMSPDKGPYPRFYSDPENAINLRSHEQVIIILLKFIVAFHWTTVRTPLRTPRTPPPHAPPPHAAASCPPLKLHRSPLVRRVCVQVIARFVFVFNNLDKDQKEFQLGWDALNRFCSFFRLEQKMAVEMRQYYIERNKEVRARSRRKVLNQFSPKLAEDVVWELDKRWLVRVPCFSLVAERVTGDELRFFVKVALAMDVAVYVPKDRPPPRRLYMITQGVALYKGEQLGIGESWGAEDVLLYGRPNPARLRAFSMTYLHVQWLDANVLEGLKEEFPRAHLLCRFWTMMHAVGDFLIQNLRQSRAKPVVLPAADFEARINARQIEVQPTGAKNAEGSMLYRSISHYVSQGSYEIVIDDDKVLHRPRGGSASPDVYSKPTTVAVTALPQQAGDGKVLSQYRVIDRLGKGPARPTVADAAQSSDARPTPGDARIRRVSGPRSGAEDAWGASTGVLDTLSA